jgi:hypothetical protein
MEKFIRLDTKGQWKGVEHISSMNGMGDDTYFEAGISCYRLNDIADALENLRQYWTELAMVTDFSDMQVTIFEGERLDENGSEGEDLATCERTLFEFNAQELMQTVIELHELYYYDDEISEDEYMEKISQLIA